MPRNREDPCADNSKGQEDSRDDQVVADNLALVAAGESGCDYIPAGDEDHPQGGGEEPDRDERAHAESPDGAFVPNGCIPGNRSHKSRSGSELGDHDKD